MARAGVFVDTSGWANLVDRDESHHDHARARYQEAVVAGQRLVTTNYVITELVAVMERPLRIPRSEAIRFVQSLLGSPHVEVLHITAETHHYAWTLLAARPDKSWSLVDCASFVVMEERGIAESLTTDHHFEQAGFSALLR